jgi:hypothetical protein
MSQPQHSLIPKLTKSVFFAFAISMLGACASSPDTGHQTARTAESEKPDEDSFDVRLSRLKLGMSKSQVIAIMGDDYLPGGRSLTDRGTFETLTYEPSFGNRSATALIRSYSFGAAGRKRTDGATLQFREGHLAGIHQF